MHSPREIRFETFSCKHDFSGWAHSGQGWLQSRSELRNELSDCGADEGYTYKCSNVGAEGQTR